jgi:hypothetical protein
MDGFYLVRCEAAGKCLACGEVIPLGWREYPDNRQWLRLHWAGRFRASTCFNVTAEVAKNV